MLLQVRDLVDRYLPRVDRELRAGQLLLLLVLLLLEVVADGGVVGLVLQSLVHRNAENLLQNVPNLQDHCPVVRGSIPDSERVFLVFGRNHKAANLFAKMKVIANQSQQRILPAAVGHALLQPNDPLASFLVGVVLPEGNDAFPEALVVDAGHVIGPLKVRIATPKRLHRVKSSNLLDSLLIVVCTSVSLSLQIPKRESALKRVSSRHWIR